MSWSILIWIGFPGILRIRKKVNVVTAHNVSAPWTTTRNV